MSKHTHTCRSETKEFGTCHAKVFLWQKKKKEKNNKQSKATPGNRAG